MLQAARSYRSCAVRQLYMDNNIRLLIEADSACEISSSSTQLPNDVRHTRDDQYLRYPRHLGHLFHSFVEAEAHTAVDSDASFPLSNALVPRNGLQTQDAQLHNLALDFCAASKVLIHSNKISIFFTPPHEVIQVALSKRIKIVRVTLNCATFAVSIAAGIEQVLSVGMFTDAVVGVVIAAFTACGDDSTKLLFLSAATRVE
ncbi:hypothetical protein PsorP6_002213 [Peronosclerospora sorghi]|uniref:Uncharacterized protein n=1 Tax=Peronosclerospora sorghi TaxID=230839 RepID=A0ACC0WRS7_9STRA|nr:hypothetical protein PsorP6_002213 [Peronosclerospora sorghi]